MTLLLGYVQAGLLQWNCLTCAHMRLHCEAIISLLLCFLVANPGLCVVQMVPYGCSHARLNFASHTTVSLICNLAVVWNCVCGCWAVLCLLVAQRQEQRKVAFALCLTLRGLLFGNNGSDPPKSFFLKEICLVLFLFGKKRIGILGLWTSFYEKKQILTCLSDHFEARCGFTGVIFTHFSDKTTTEDLWGGS